MEMHTKFLSGKTQEYIDVNSFPNQVYKLKEI